MMWLLYIDPGSGSVLFQMLIAGFLGFLFYLKRIKNFFLRLVGRQKKNDALPPKANNQEDE